MLAARATKKRRLTCNATPPIPSRGTGLQKAEPCITDAERIQVLRRWLAYHGVMWDEEAMDIVHEGVLNGIGVVSKQALRRGHNVAHIPKAAVLSVRNTEIAKVIDEANLGHVGLNLAIAYEIAVGVRSKWYGYFQSLAGPFEPLPHLWETDARLALVGTDAEHAAEERRSELRDEYNTHVKPLLHRLPLDGSSLSMEVYLHAESLATSRAYMVDDYHGESLVPLADLFNHQCRKVPEGGAVVDQPEEASAKGTCKRRRRSSNCRPDPARAREPVFSPWTGPVPLMAICLGEETNVNTESQTGGNLMTGTGPDGSLMVYVTNDIPPGCEILGTYGEYSNDKLLQDYGFVLEHNAFNTVMLLRSTVVAVAKENLGLAHCNKRLRFARRNAETLGLTKIDEDASTKAALQCTTRKENTLECLYEIPIQGLPMGLLGILAVLHADVDTLQLWKSMPPDELQIAFRERKLNVSRFEEKCVRDTFEECLRRRLEAYPLPLTTAAEDRIEWLSTSNLNYRLRAALGLRICEKEIIEYWLRYLAKASN